MAIENEQDRLFVESIFNKYSEKMYLIAMDIINNHHDAEDCVHDTIDLTQYAKLLITEKYYKLENNTIMFKIKNGSEGCVIFASTDNSVMPPFFEVKYRTK